MIDKYWYIVVYKKQIKSYLGGGLDCVCGVAALKTCNTQDFAIP